MIKKIIELSLMNPKLKEVRENSKGNKELSAIVGFCKTSLGMIKQEEMNDEKGVEKFQQNLKELNKAAIRKEDPPMFTNGECSGNIQELKQYFSFDENNQTFAHIYETCEKAFKEKYDYDNDGYIYNAMKDIYGRTYYTNPREVTEGYLKACFENAKSDIILTMDEGGHRDFADEYLFNNILAFLQQNFFSDKLPVGYKDLFKKLDIEKPSHLIEKKQELMKELKSAELLTKTEHLSASKRLYRRIVCRHQDGKMVEFQVLFIPKIVDLLDKVMQEQNPHELFYEEDTIKIIVELKEDTTDLAIEGLKMLSGGYVNEFETLYFRLATTQDEDKIIPIVSEMSPNLDEMYSTRCKDTGKERSTVISRIKIDDNCKICKKIINVDYYEDKSDTLMRCLESYKLKQAYENERTE